MTTRRLTGWLSVALLMATLGWNTPAAHAAIVLDGGIGDWTPADILYANSEISDAGNPDAAYNTVHVTHDASNLYVAIVTDGGNGGTILNDWTHNIYIDTDTNAATGYASTWFSHGYDVLAQYGSSGTVYSAFGFTGGTQSQWSWSFINTISYAFGGNVIELAIPLSYLGNPTAVTLEFNATGGSAAGETWAYQFESGAKTYTLVPEPASLALLAGALLLPIGRKRRPA
jgi:hypothetical protein